MKNEENDPISESLINQIESIQDIEDEEEEEYLCPCCVASQAIHLIDDHGFLDILLYIAVRKAKEMLEEDFISYVGDLVVQVASETDEESQIVLERMIEDYEC